jgi:peroxidase
LQTIYDSFEDVDLMVGGSIESDVEGSFAGPTFFCLLIDQFKRTRSGDRLFFENNPANNEAGFRRDQLEEIRKSSFAGILCNNMKHLDSIQPEAFRLISEK